MARTSVVVRGDSYRLAMRLVDVGGRLVEVHIRRSKRVHGHRIYFRNGMPPELVVRPRASDEEIDVDSYRVIGRCLERVAPRDLVTLTERDLAT